MESPRNKIKNFLILAAFLALVLGGWYLQQKSFIARLYTGAGKGTVAVVMLAEPAVIMDFSSEKNSVTVSNAVLPKPKNNKNPLPELTYMETAQKLLESKNIKTDILKYYVPRSKDAAWDDFKNVLSSWRYNPLLCVEYMYGYARALAGKKTNIWPHEFLLLSFGVINLEMTDFSLQSDPPKNTKNKTAPPESAPQRPADDRPLIVGIFNASGEKGAALKLSQYLASLNEKGLMKVDVIEKDNYHKMENDTKIIDFTGKTKEVKQLSLNLGLRDSEIFKETNPDAYYDAKIIIGKNFKMPK